MASSQNASGPVVKEHLYKVLVIGEFGVGKTSLIRRYTEGFFSPNYKLTIGVDFALKTLQWSDDTKINLQLWDIAGHERFGHMTRVYYKYAIAGIIVYDLSRPATFDSVLKWHRDVNQKVMLANEQPVPVLLLANKCDLEDAHFDPNLLDEFCKEHGFIGWYPTSAKDNQNVEEAMTFLVEKILSLTSSGQSQPQEYISLKDRDNDHTNESEVEDEGQQPPDEQGRKCCNI